ncbi:MAG: sodium/proton antiporter NhaB [Gammaproteobacteria bacterium]|nr:sodium/proton antiporter NhaB [Gammaproteobacteria bacterium]
MISNNLSDLWHNFLGHTPNWYKKTIVFFIILNPLFLLFCGKNLTTWAILLEFIFTLAMTLKCYPLQPGGLLALQALLLNLTTPEHIYQEVLANTSVIFLLIFMLASVYFMKDLLLFLFSNLLIRVKNKRSLALLFLMSSGLLSAILDALTVMAIIITALYGFYLLYHQVASGNLSKTDSQYTHLNDNYVKKTHQDDLTQFRAFLRSLVMHSAIGTTLGGACTIIGEPQNLLIAQYTKWNFLDYMYTMAPITFPLFITGLILCYFLEKYKLFGYGAEIPKNVYVILSNHHKKNKDDKKHNTNSKLFIQATVALLLIFALAFHVAEIGLIGLTMLILLTAFNGVTDELQIGNAFKEAMPFTSLLIVFFAIISIIQQQHLFKPMIDYALSLDLSIQPAVFYLANGVLSSISDNIFVASIYITQAHDTLVNGIINQEHFNKLAVAINIGTNIPSIATPNGQAAFLFLLASALAPLIRLSYWRMLVMAGPYTIILSIAGLLLICFI